jgi:putative oxidoreductase
MKNLLATDTHNSILTLQRALLGAVMFPHGAQKLLGWFGGYGFDGSMKFFTDTLHLPAPLALLVILGESIGALLLIAGLGTRVAAFGISAIMLGAVLTTHGSVGFFMNWYGSQAGEGFALARARPERAAGDRGRRPLRARQLVEGSARSERGGARRAARLNRAPPRGAAVRAAAPGAALAAAR